MENLRYMLYLTDPNFPVYFGLKFKLFVVQGYMSGGAGYVLSKAALELFVKVRIPCIHINSFLLSLKNTLIGRKKVALQIMFQEGIPKKHLCRPDDGGAEDVELGKCLANVNVIAGDSRDPEGRGRFFAFVPQHHLIPGHVDEKFWYWRYIFYNESKVSHYYKLKYVLRLFQKYNYTSCTFQDYNFVLLEVIKTKHAAV